MPSPTYLLQNTYDETEGTRRACLQVLQLLGPLPSLPMSVCIIQHSALERSQSDCV